MTDICTSKDFEKIPYSAVLDKSWTKVKTNFLKIVIWYDNEWGYSSQSFRFYKNYLNEDKYFNR